MSTRSTIWYDPKGGEDSRPDLHVFSECFDDTVWLELQQGPITVNFQTPQEAMKAILASKTCAEYAGHTNDGPPPLSESDRRGRYPISPAEQLG